MYIIRTIKTNSRRFHYYFKLYFSAFCLALLIGIFIFITKTFSYEKDVKIDKIHYGTVISRWIDTYDNSFPTYYVKLDIKSLEKIEDCRLNKQEYENTYIGKKLHYRIETIRSEWVVLFFSLIVLATWFSIIFVNSFFDYIRWFVKNRRIEIVKKDVLKQRLEIDPYEEEDWRIK